MKTKYVTKKVLQQEGNCLYQHFSQQSHQTFKPAMNKIHDTETVKIGLVMSYDKQMILLNGFAVERQYVPNLCFQYKFMQMCLIAIEQRKARNTFQYENITLYKVFVYNTKNYEHYQQVYMKKSLFCMVKRLPTMKQINLFRKMYCDNGLVDSFFVETKKKTIQC